MPVPQISVAELEAALGNGAPLFDVREPHEYASKRVEGGILIPMGNIVDSLETFPDDRTIYLICASGARSGRAVEFLRSKGLDAINVAGGINAWVDSGRPVVSESNTV